MTRNNTLLGGKLVLATVVATGMAAAPVALSPAFMPQSNAASAQTADTVEAGVQTNGFAEERTEERLTGTADDDNVYRLLGTTREQAEQADTMMSASTQAGPLKGYQTAVENDNLETAAKNLAAISERPITERLVVDVNTELGVETRLTAKQIADTAAREKDSDS